MHERWLPAELVFPCGDDDNNSTNNSTSTNTSEFGLLIFLAGGGPAVGGWDVDFIRISVVHGNAYYVLISTQQRTQQRLLGYQWYAVMHIQISVLRSDAY